MKNNGKAGRPRMKTLVGLGAEAVAAETEVVAIPDATVRYLSSPAALERSELDRMPRWEWDWDKEVEAAAAQAAKTHGKVEAAIVTETPTSKKTGLFDIEVGQHFKSGKVNGRTLLRGVFSNSDFRKQSEAGKRLIIGRIEPILDAGHLRVTALDINSPSEVDREKLKKAISAGRKTTSVLGAGLEPGMVEELKFDLDIKSRVVNSVSSGNGARCYALSSYTLEESAKYGSFQIEPTVIDISQSENLALKKGDVIFVCSKKVLDALVLQTTHAIDTPKEYSDSAIASQIQVILRQAKQKDGVLNVYQVYRQIAAVYAKQMQVNNERESLASSFMVYQLS